MILFRVECFPHRGRGCVNMRTGRVYVDALVISLPLVCIQLIWLCLVLITIFSGKSCITRKCLKELWGICGTKIKIYIGRHHIQKVKKKQPRTREHAFVILYTGQGGICMNCATYTGQLADGFESWLGRIDFGGSGEEGGRGERGERGGGLARGGDGALSRRVWASCCLVQHLCPTSCTMQVEVCPYHVIWTHQMVIQHQSQKTNITTTHITNIQNDEEKIQDASSKCTSFFCGSDEW